ncbi:DNA/RNA non-specific endonuclease [Flavobacterium sp.]|jgi:endonuclease G|uniref:DNA/RNA non-specific endonuclease n=1 Tax=Flavobacterium sp. TaxID=239 RepID=UPI0037C0DF0B
MYKLSFVSTLILILFLSVSCRDNYVLNDAGSDASTDRTELTKINWNEFDFYPTSTTGQVIRHNFYALSYHEEHEQAEWVAYELKSSYSSKYDYKRPYFIEDPKVKTGSADWRNYKNSGYDKGHLCPAGDMKFSKQAYNETFYTSNISPQKADFNAGVWNRLEQKVRYWADKYDGLYVITGGILDANLKTIGEEDVSVPDYFYKILFDVSNDKPRIIAFLVPHKNSDRPLYEFVVSVDELEELTGIDFFHHLPNEIENQIEKNADYKSWSFN